MKLSNTDITKLAKAIAKPSETTKVDKTYYATVTRIVSSDEEGISNSAFVKMDGSNIETPIDPTSITVSVKEGDRVTVMLKDNVAVITGNLSDRAVGFVDLSDPNSETVIDGENIDTDTLIAKNIECSNEEAGFLKNKTIINDSSLHIWGSDLHFRIPEDPVMYNHVDLYNGKVTVGYSDYNYHNQYQESITLDSCGLLYYVEGTRSGDIKFVYQPSHPSKAQILINDIPEGIVGWLVHGGSGISVRANTLTSMTMNTEYTDVKNAFSLSNGRIRINYPGYYRITAKVRLSASFSSTDYATLSLYSCYSSTSSGEGSTGNENIAGEYTAGPVLGKGIIDLIYNGIRYFPANRWIAMNVSCTKACTTSYNSQCGIYLNRVSDGYSYDVDWDM